MVIGASLFGIACGDDEPMMMADAMPDAMSDAGPDAMPDAMPDATPDAMPDAMPDATPDAMPMPGCTMDSDCMDAGASYACVRGVCIDSCGVDLAELRPLLETANLTPVSHSCDTYKAVGVRNTASGGELVALRAGTVATELEVVSVGLSATSAPTSVFTYDTGGMVGMETFLNNYVSVTAAGDKITVGYTNLGGTGQIVTHDVSSSVTAGTTAPSNFDTAWVMEAGVMDPTLMVSGAGFDASGTNSLYKLTPMVMPGAQQLAVGGCFSGSLSVSDDYVVFGSACSFGATWPDGTEGDRSFVIPRSQLETGTPLSIYNMDGLASGVTQLDGFSLHRMLGDGRIASYAYDAMFGLNATVYMPTYDGTTSSFTLGEPVMTLASDAISFRRLIATSEGLVLHMGSSWMLLTEAS